MTNNFEDCPPRAESIIHSLRAFGYDLGMAIADLIDNSIFAEATNIWVDYSWNNGDPWVRVIDNGRGMDETSLREAMRLGSTSPLSQRDPKDLGRFGLGLKTASFSQCKLISVLTKTSDGQVSTRFWDLDMVGQSWKLGKQLSEGSSQLLSPVQNLKNGTGILWQKIDRICDLSSGTYDTEVVFLEKFLAVKQYLEMVFHQYLEKKRNGVRINIGIGSCKPWDPFLRSNTFTQELSGEKYEDNRVKILPYILPHISKRTDLENIIGGGIKGWNAQQGFYVYRNGRMIVSGGYLDLDLKEEEHFKLARIAIDITNDMDHEWSIDVRKAVAIPPDRLKGELLRIARSARQRASEIYRARTGTTRQRAGSHNTDDVWLKLLSNGKITYKLNPHNVVLTRLLSELNPYKKWVKKFFHVIETTVPHRLIIMDGLEHEDCHVDLPIDLNPPPAELLTLCLELYDEYRAAGRRHEDIVDILCGMDVFSVHPCYRAILDDNRQGGVRDECN